MEFKSFYQVLLDALKGKRVILRSYDPDDYTQFLNNDTDEADETPKIWDDNGNYLEWSGTVIDILQNDNSHVDIIFDENLPRTRPSDDYNWDCYNWHMKDYIKILD